jgi:hypothetical protein
MFLAELSQLTCVSVNRTLSFTAKILVQPHVQNLGRSSLLHGRPGILLKTLKLSFRLCFFLSKSSYLSRVFMFLIDRVISCTCYLAVTLDMSVSITHKTLIHKSLFRTLVMVTELCLMRAFFFFFEQIACATIYC